MLRPGNVAMGAIRHPHGAEGTCEGTPGMTGEPCGVSDQTQAPRFGTVAWFWSHLPGPIWDGLQAVSEQSGPRRSMAKVTGVFSLDLPEYLLVHSLISFNNIRHLPEGKYLGTHLTHSQMPGKPSWKMNRQRNEKLKVDIEIY